MRDSSNEEFRSIVDTYKQQNSYKYDDYMDGVSSEVVHYFVKEGGFWIFGKQEFELPREEVCSELIDASTPRNVEDVLENFSQNKESNYIVIGFGKPKGNVINDIKAYYSHEDTSDHQ